MTKENYCSGLKQAVEIAYIVYYQTHLGSIVSGNVFGDIEDVICELEENYEEFKIVFLANPEKNTLEDVTKSIVEKYMQKYLSPGNGEYELSSKLYEAFDTNGEEGVYDIFPRVVYEHSEELNKIINQFLLERPSDNY